MFWVSQLVSEHETQITSLQILMCQLAGNSTEEKVKLIKLQSLQVPVITSASQSSAGNCNIAISDICIVFLAQGSSARF